jgi:hypothetical protein
MCPSSLVETTKVEEEDEVYYTKIALSIGRSRFLQFLDLIFSKIHI